MRRVSYKVDSVIEIRDMRRRNTSNDVIEMSYIIIRLVPFKGAILLYFVNRLGYS
jgi:hypothetical protein